MTVKDTSFGYERAVKIRAMAQNTRHDIVSHIAAHPEGLPSLVELDAALPANKSTLYGHLDMLTEKQVLVRYERDSENCPQNAPRVFYGLTPTGYSIVKESAAFDDIEALQEQYDAPSETESHEPVRPPHAQTISDLEANHE